MGDVRARMRESDWKIDARERGNKGDEIWGEKMNEGGGDN